MRTRSKITATMPPSTHKSLRIYLLQAMSLKRRMKTRKSKRKKRKEKKRRKKRKKKQRNRYLTM